MLLSEINPYVRFARYIDLDDNSYYAQVTPLDARLFYALDGCGKIQVEDKTYEMRPYSLLIITSGFPCKLHTPLDAVQYIGINFDYTRNAASRTVPVRPVSADRFASDMLVDFNTFEDAPVHRYVLHVRLMNAANLLENTPASIGEIALSCGFCDAACFSGYFKKYFGISPSQYRNA